MVYQISQISIQPNEARFLLPAKIWRFLASVGINITTVYVDFEQIVDQMILDFQEAINNTFKFERRHPRGQIILNTWKVGELLGQGAFGIVYSAEDIRTGEQVAIKMEVRDERSVLNREKRIYALLKERFARNEGRVMGFPRVRYFGITGKRNVLVMDCLGRSLRHYAEVSTFYTRRVVLEIAIHVVVRLQELHAIGYIHRDVKPSNLLLGKDEPYTVYLIDFGLSKRYILPDGTHITYREGVELNGTFQYASVNAHNGIEESRRDDLESLGYLLVYLFKGSLPWQYSRTGVWDRRNGRNMGKFKRDYPLAKLCMDMPGEMVEYFRYVRQLRFEERPDYTWIINLFRQGMESPRVEVP